MRIPKKWTAAFACLLVLLAGGSPLGAASATSAAPPTPQPNGSEGSLYIFSHTGTLIDDPAYIFSRTEPLYGSGSPQHMMEPITATPASVSGSTQTFAYIASATKLRAGGTSAWEAWTPGPHPEGGIIAPTLTADHHDMGAVGLDGVFADVGGTYNLGVAFTKNNGVTVDSAVYRTMRILAGNRFTLDPITPSQEHATPDKPAQPEPESQQPSAVRPENTETEQIGPESTGTESTEPSSELQQEQTGKFEIVMPTETGIYLGEVKRGGTLTAHNTLDEITVIDDRAESQGWELTLSATNFEAADHTAIPASALGYSPSAASELPPGITPGPNKPVHTEIFMPIANGAPKSSTTSEGARFTLGLQFSPPADAAVGRYTSTLSFTLISR